MSTGKTIKDDALYRQVARFVADFRTANGGLQPTRDQVIAVLKRRRSDVLVALNRLEEAEATDAARLDALPDLPEQVRAASAALVDQVWVAANESAAVAVGELRRRLADAEHRHGRQMSEAIALLDETELELEGTTGRADAAESELTASKQENARLAAALDRARAALEDREAILALFGGQAPGSRGAADADADEAPGADKTAEVDGSVGDVSTASDSDSDGDGDGPGESTGPVGRKASERAKGTADKRGPRTGRASHPDGPKIARLPVPGLDPSRNR